MKKLIVGILLVGSGLAQEQLLTAKRIKVIGSVTCAESANHQDNVTCAKRLSRILGAVPLPPAIAIRYVEDNPDLIMDIEAEQNSWAPTIKLSLIDAETNEELWSESRKLIDPKNDKVKLLEHLLAASRVVKTANESEPLRIGIPRYPKGTK